MANRIVFSMPYVISVVCCKLHIVKIVISSSPPFFSNLAKVSSMVQISVDSDISQQLYQV